MIAHVRGQIVEKFANSAIIDVQGVGYEVTLTASGMVCQNLSRDW